MVKYICPVGHLRLFLIDSIASLGFRNLGEEDTDLLVISAIQYALTGHIPKVRLGNKFKDDTVSPFADVVVTYFSRLGYPFMEVFKEDGIGTLLETVLEESVKEIGADFQRYLKDIYFLQSLKNIQVSSWVMGDSVVLTGVKDDNYRF